MFDLIEKVGRIHERESQARDGILREEFIDVATDEIRAAKAAGLNGKTFGLEPFLKKRNLRGTAGAVHALDDDEAAGDFVGIETDERLAKERLRGIFFNGNSGRSRFRRLRLEEYRCFVSRFCFGLRLCFRSFARVHRHFLSRLWQQR